MRFIGNKEKLVDWIYSVIKSKKIKGKRFFDFFSGTTTVARYFKEKEYNIISSDLLYFSFVLQKAYIENHETPKFEKLLDYLKVVSNIFFPEPLDLIIQYLNDLQGKAGFIYNNYSPGGTKNLQRQRLFFSDYNSKKIDHIRITIEEWKQQNLLTENEYYILLACLIETVPYYANISGVYAAFCKSWDPRALKKIVIKPIKILESNRKNSVYNVDSVSLVDKIKCDILYMDPPYNHRQYAPNYHLLETIAKYDYPELKGVTGLRKNYENQKSLFCSAKAGLDSLKYIIENISCNTIFLSYNSEGVMPQDEILKIFSKIGNPEIIEQDYLRFKSNNNGLSKTKKYVKEQIYFVEKK